MKPRNGSDCRNIAEASYTYHRQWNDHPALPLLKKPPKIYEHNFFYFILITNFIFITLFTKTKTCIKYFRYNVINVLM